MTFCTWLQIDHHKNCSMIAAQKYQSTAAVKIPSRQPPGNFSRGQNPTRQEKNRSKTIALRVRSHVQRIPKAPPQEKQEHKFYKAETILITQIFDDILTQKNRFKHLLQKQYDCFSIDLIYQRNEIIMNENKC